MRDESQQKPSKTMAFAMVGRTFLLCTVPSVVCALGGRWVDRRLHLSLPIATSLGLLFALYVVYVLILREAERYRRFFS